jgi:hypothetical protein
MGTLSTGERRGSDSARGIPCLLLDRHPLAAKQLDTGTPMNPSTPVTQRTGAEPTVTGCNSTLTWRALLSHCHSIDTARAAGTGGNCECWPHTLCASCHRLLDAAHGGEAAALLGTEAFRWVGEESLAQRGTFLSRLATGATSLRIAWDIVLVAVLSIYLLIDGSRITSWLRHNVPRYLVGMARDTSR